MSGTTPGVRAGVASGVTGAARIRAVADGRGGTALPLLAGEGALAVRRTRAPSPGAAVTLVGAMSAPLGGDRLRVDVTVEAGARLTVGSAAATVALPGRNGQPAFYDVRLRVSEGAVLHWLPEPVIAAAGSHLRMTTRADLAPGALLVLREELVLGRHGESPGRLSGRLTVTSGSRTHLDQELSAGPGAAPGWDGPACLGGHRAVGQLLLAGVEGAARLPRLLTGHADAVRAVATPLAGAPATLVTALAPDARELRPLLTRTLRAALDNGLPPVPSPSPRLPVAAGP